MRRHTDQPEVEDFEAHWLERGIRHHRAERLFLALLFVLGFGSVLLLCSAGAALWMLVRP